MATLYNEFQSKGKMSGIILALIAALFWGSGDFSGGYATRKASPFQVLALSAIAGVTVLGVAALVSRESLPVPGNILWSLLAGLCGAIGITSLYTGLSRGNTAAVAPISAVLGAALPVGFTLIVTGAPAVLQMIGFAVALVGIWLVSAAAPTTAGNKKGLGLAFLAGAGFSGYFIFIGQVKGGGVFFPLLVARTLMLVVSLVMLKGRRLAFPPMRQHPMALVAGLLDSLGNVFFLLAKNLTRLDFAVIISSLYPAVTVLLAALLLKEKVAGWQKAGIVLCLAAIILVSV